MSASATVLPEKATHQQMRTFNQQLVLRALHDHSPLSRADLARLTGLTRTSVGDLVGTLIDDGLIEEVGRGRSSGGKSPILLRVAPDGRHLIGLDLGEAQFSGAVVNLRGEILRSIHLPLEAATAMPRSSSSSSSSTPCAPMTCVRSSASASARPASSTRAPAPSAGRSTWTGPTSASGRCSSGATAYRSSSPTTVMLPRSPS